MSILFRRVLPLLAVLLVAVGGAAVPAQAAAMSTVAGRVTGPDGEPVSAVIGFYPRAEDGTYGAATFAYSDANGDYVAAVAAGTTKISFGAVGTAPYVREFYDDVATLDAATPVLLETSGLRTIDATLSTKPTVAGQVTGSDGSPLAGALVDLWHFSGATAAVADQVHTDADGHYLATADGPGEYAVSVTSSMDAPHQPEWWGGAFNRDTATRFTLADMEERTGTDVQLDAFASLEGTVRGPGGARLEDPVYVVLLRTNPAGVLTEVASQLVLYRADLDDPGHFAFTDLPRGSYTLRFDGVAGIYQDQYWSGADTEDDATVLSVTSGAWPEPVDVDLAPATLDLRPLSIDGLPRVGEVLTATGGDSPIQDATIVRTWSRDGQPIDGADGATYTLTPDDLGHQISLHVAVSWPGWPSDTADAELPGTVTAAVAPAVVSPSFVELKGDLRAGATLIAHPGEIDVVGTPPTAQQWLRDGAAIPGATGLQYVVAPADAGHRLSLRLTWQLPYRPARVVTTDPSPAVPYDAAPVATAPPGVTGAARVGQTLTATAGQWPAGTAVTYQWLRSGRPVPGATGRTYRLVGSDLGAAMSVRVTGRVVGHLDGTATSTTTRPVTATSSTTVKAQAAGRGTVVLVVTVRSAGVPASALTGGVRVTVGGQQVAATKVRRGRVRIELTRQAVGRRSYRVAYAGTSLIAGSTRSVPVTVR